MAKPSKLSNIASAGDKPNSEGKKPANPSLETASVNNVNAAANVLAHRGLFITFEGGEGAGKSSQISLLKKHMEEMGWRVVVTREPGGSTGAEAVRHVLLSGAAEAFGADMEAILFSAARADHVSSIIEPALEAGKVVLCDRFFDSTRVYQGAGGKVDKAFLRRLERIACGSTWPDLTLVIDLDPEEGMARAQSRRAKSEMPDRFEKEDLALQQLRRDAYLEIAKAEPNRCRVIDGAGDQKQVAERIWAVVGPKLLLLDSGNSAAKPPTRLKPIVTSGAKKPASRKQIAKI